MCSAWVCSLNRVVTFFGVLCVIAEICEAKNGVRAGRPPSRLEGERISVSLDLDQVQFAESYLIFAFFRKRNL